MNVRALTARLLVPILLGLAVPLAGPLFGQDRLPGMPGYDRFQEVSPEVRGAYVSGALFVTWAEDGGSFEYSQGGQSYRYDVATRTVTTLPAEPATERGRFGMGNRPARGRQYDSALSPDSTLRAFYRDRNLYISSPDGTGEIAVTTEGDEEARTKFGSGSWVYGEELNQNTAMWWSPDGSKLAYYGFDESPVPDYYLPLSKFKDGTSRI